MWLRGSTDITNFNADIYDLLRGAIVAGQRGSGQAGNGNQLTGTDVWTGIDATNRVVRSQKTESPFTGEYKLYRGCPRFAARATGTIMSADPQQFMGKPTFSGTYNGATARVYFAAFVSTNNSSPGNLTGTIVTWTLVNAVTGATVTSGTASGWAGASDTKVLAQGVSLTLTLTAGQTFVAGTNAVMWLRAYTTTYTDGIDYFPEAAKISGAITVSNTTGGANNYTVTTDYQIVQEAHQFPQQSTTIGTFSVENDWGVLGAGCGIHWVTGGSPAAVGANYFIPATYTVYAGYLQIPTLATSGGNYVLFGGPMEYWDSTLQVGRGVYSNSPTATTSTQAPQTLSQGQLFTGVAQPGTTFIDFWMSVTESKIVFVFRGDTGQGGRIVVMTFQRYTTLVNTDDWPWIWMPDGSHASNAFATHLVTSKYVYDQPYWGDPAVAMGVIDGPFYYTNSGAVYEARPAGISNETIDGGIPDQNPNNWDLRWWLYTIYHNARFGGSNISGTFDASKESGIRGKLRGIFALANDNFTNLNELVDATTTYLLVIPTSAWDPSQDGLTLPTLAILEE